MAANDEVIPSMTRTFSHHGSNMRTLLLLLVVVTTGCSGIGSGAEHAGMPIRFLMPDADSPTYRISVMVPAREMHAGRIDRIEANGVECRDYTLIQSGTEIYDRGTVADESLTITARFAWRAGQEVELAVVWEETGESWQATGTAGPTLPGWWNDDWRHYAGVLVSETAGIPRHGEPLHVTMGLFADRMSDPAREIRVVTYAPHDDRADDRGYVELPSQVYNVTTWQDEQLLSVEVWDEATGERILRYSPTTTLDVAFLADVASLGSQAYLVFYGNPDAPPPAYETDLRIEGEGLGATVENEFYRISHAANSGAIFTVDVKQGVNVVLEHKLETNGAVQWNPDVYAPPHAWVHASDWEEPEHEIVCGPVFCMFRRWAPLPHLPDVMASSTNLYYAGTPYVLVTETTSFEQDRYVKALRQAEVVFNHEVLDEFAYVDQLGVEQSFPIEGTRPHPAHAIDLPLETSWMAFFNRQRQVAFAYIPLEGAATSLLGGMPRLENAYFYVENGPWVYLARPLVYPFGSNNASRMVYVPRGALYTSRTAYAPVRLADGRDPFRPIKELQQTLTEPLLVRVFLDTDARTPRGWVTPILTEPFDEGVEGAIGRGSSLR
jgi:hypothetical protein